MALAHQVVAALPYRDAAGRHSHRRVPNELTGTCESGSVTMSSRPHSVSGLSRDRVRTSDPSLARRHRTVARRRLKCQLTALTLAGSRHVSPGACLCWLPIWLPEISLGSLTTKLRTKTARRRESLHLHTVCHSPDRRRHISGRLRHCRARLWPCLGLMEDPPRIRLVMVSRSGPEHGRLGA